MSRPARDLPAALPWALGLCVALLHLPLLGRYGYHGDELYFLSCGVRPDLGYVDHAPLVPLLAAATQQLSGDSLWLLRLAPCLAGGLTVALTAKLANALGGGRGAALFAALAVGLAPFFLRTAGMFSIPSFEPVWWTLAALLLVRIVDRGRSRLWLWFGVAAGLGLMTKHTMLLWGFALLVGLLTTSARRQLAARWPWLGAGIALLIFLPNLVWQVAHDWPTVHFAVDLNRTAMAGIGRLDFLLGQLLYAGPGNALLWLPGFVFLLLRPGAGRLLGVAFAVVLGVLLLLQSKIYYSLPAYPVLFAAGALFWERVLRTRRARGLLGVAVIAPGLLLLPLSLPILPIATADRFAAVATFGLVDKAYEITGDLHNMYGWPEVAAGMTAAEAELPTADRERLLRLVNSYSVAGALERFAPSPTPILCNHMSWHFWSRDVLAALPAGPAPVVLAYGWGVDELRRWFADVQRVAMIPGDSRGQPEVVDQPVHLCREPRRQLVELWPERPSL